MLKGEKHTKQKFKNWLSTYVQFKTTGVVLFKISTQKLFRRIGLCKRRPQIFHVHDERITSD